MVEAGFKALPPISLGDQASFPVAITAGDFTGHGVLDLAVVDQNSNGVSILEGNGQGGFVALPPISLGDDLFNTPGAIVAGDFTGSGILDLAVVSVSFDAPDSVSILLGKGDGTFNPPQTISLLTSFEHYSIATGSFFGGGTLDLAIADPGTNSVSLLQGDGQGGFQLMPELELGGQGSSDGRRDGRLHRRRPHRPGHRVAIAQLRRGSS